MFDIAQKFVESILEKDDAFIVDAVVSSIEGLEKDAILWPFIYWARKNAPHLIYDTNKLTEDGIRVFKLIANRLADYGTSVILSNLSEI